VSRYTYRDGLSIERASPDRTWVRCAIDGGAQAAPGRVLSWAEIEPDNRTISAASADPRVAVDIEPRFPGGGEQSIRRAAGYARQAPLIRGACEADPHDAAVKGDTR